MQFTRVWIYLVTVVIIGWLQHDQPFLSVTVVTVINFHLSLPEQSARSFPWNSNLPTALWKTEKDTRLCRSGAPHLLRLFRALVFLQNFFNTFSEIYTHENII